LIGLVASLAGAILVHWTTYSDPERIVFTALLGLGLYMLYRVRRARQLLQTRSEGWERGTIEHIGFTLISLFEGFIIVTGLNVGGPGWLIALLALLGVLTGRWAVGPAQRRADRYPSALAERKSEG
jgi:uncharacterized membrane protein YfcA